MAKFDRRNTDESLNTHTPKERLLLTENDIAHYNRGVEKINSQIAELKRRKAALRKRISNKTVYKHQLLKQLGEQN